MPTVGAPVVWHHTGRARVADASTRIRSAVRKRRAWARARRRAIRIIHDELGLRPGQGLQELLHTVAHERGRTITVQKLPLPSHVSGFCVQGEAEDTIVITSNTSERQGLHVLLHELYHLLSGSPADVDPYAITVCDLLDPRLVADQLPSLPADVVREVLTRPVRLRTGYEEDEEWSAEVFATVGMLMLSLDDDIGRTGPLASFTNRHAGI
ncbi:hypothetical protein [Streptomyces flavofungini]|uniref:IrrE N-terminal-like domain-containing protein n=1 Tax=Streptomyces flavofungini TaxID=68200 RepID=A0ABS0XD43_9ACTN|nr:hypothetical protein [Streptomyces flavofungini]MBJ3811133.1 hypothetical protein [Streptomyces flavofungini]GHC67802.1 hypothetical protein GCM10010349_41110 [Streptomyces flavofungini]